MTDPTAEPSQRAEYRAKIAAIVDEIGDYPFAAAEEILAVRDTEMEQLRDIVAELRKQVVAAERLGKENRQLRAELAGMRERACAWREQLAALQSLGIVTHFEGDNEPIESWRAAPTNTPDSLERGPDTPSLLATLPPDWAERMAQVERETQEEPATGWPCKCGTDETDMVHTAERCYSTTEPVTAPVSAIVDRATGERHEYPQQAANERACECGHPVSGHGCEGCVHLVDGEYCECPTPYGGDTEEDTDA